MSELKEWTASEIEEYDDARLELAEDGRIDCTRVYIKQDVDKVIDELKAAHHKERHEYINMIAELKRKLQDQCISCPVKMQEDDVVSELKQKLEDAKATAYAESVDAGMENRRLKRALLLARAERYKMREFIAREEGNLCNQMSWRRILRENIRTMG